MPADSLVNANSATRQVVCNCAGLLKANSLICELDAFTQEKGAKKSINVREKGDLVDYLAVKDLKKTRELWEKLASERELVITRDGKPLAMMISISPETVEESLAEIRRALFSAAIRRVRKRAEREGIPDDAAIAAEIDQSRKGRGLFEK